MTAVEWLEKEFVKLEHTIGVHYKMYELLERAKKIEKQQLIEMHDKGFDSVQQLNDDYAIEFAKFYKMANNNEYHLYPNSSIEEHLEIFKKENYGRYNNV